MIKKLIEVSLLFLSELESYFVEPNSNLFFRKHYLRYCNVQFVDPLWIGKKLLLYQGENLYLDKRCALGDNTTIVAYSKVEIGEDFIAANGLHIDSGGHDPLTMQPIHSPVKIGSRVWCGMEVKILAGVTIGDDVVIGAGSVVCKDIPSNSVAMGVPAEVTKTLNRASDTDFWTWAKK